MKQLMTHLYYGDPFEEFSLSLAETLIKAGADILEIGIPYSDPVCDGGTFQRACQRALQAGMTPVKVLGGIKKIRERGFGQPIYVTSYFGPVFKMGVEKFMKTVRHVGAQGVIIPDILLEEQEELLACGKKYGINVIQFATPYSTDERLKQILKAIKRTYSSFDGFIYCVSVPGVTGARKELKKQTIGLIKLVKRLTDIPAFVGFGISKPEHVQELVKAGADGVIVGSAIARLYENHLDGPATALKEIAAFTKVLKESTKRDRINRR